MGEIYNHLKDPKLELDDLKLKLEALKNQIEEAQKNCDKKKIEYEKHNISSLAAKVLDGRDKSLYSTL